MNSSNSLRTLYNLEYSTSPLQSSLIVWYNKLIDKTVDELDATDVSKMFRQKILLEIAMDKALDLFIENPFAGEMLDGDLIGLIVSFDRNIFRSYKKIDFLLQKIRELESGQLAFDWIDESFRFSLYR